MATPMDRHGVQKTVAEGGQLIDVLSAKEYEAEHIPGAINIPLKGLGPETARRLDSTQPVIVYCHDYQWDMSARAASRLETLGFRRVYRYQPGRADWFAAGLPREGNEAHLPRVADVARLDVPTCRLEERVGTVRDRVRAGGWDVCVVVDQHRVVLGLVPGEALGTDAGTPVEQVMEPSPTTVRPHLRVGETPDYLKAPRTRALVTTSDGILVGLLRLEEVEGERTREPSPRDTGSPRLGRGPPRGPRRRGPAAWTRKAQWGRRGAPVRSGLDFWQPLADKSRGRWGCPTCPTSCKLAGATEGAAVRKAINNPLQQARPPSHWGPADCASRVEAEGVFVAEGKWCLSSSLDRRTLLKGASRAVLGLLASACGSSILAASPSVPAFGTTERQAARETVYVFNVGSKDVTLIDVASRRVRETRPLGWSVRWLSNEQTYWDGARIWTYDFPDDQVQAIAIDPRQLAVIKTITGLGKGPGHSLVVLPNKKTAAVNVAGDNLIAFLDLEGGQVESTLKTGAFPWDLHLTPDGRSGYTPEREADTVSKIDMTTRKLLKTVSFPAQSKPHMLRVSPDGKEVWVQTADANTNVVLRADDLSVLATAPTGKSPVTNAWTPDRRYSIVTNGQDTIAQIFDARTFKEVKRLTIGQGGSNVGFSKDGKTAFIAVTGENAVAVIDAENLALAGQIKVGQQPQGLIVR